MSRTGLQAAIKVLKHFCRIYATYQARMEQALDDWPGPATSAQRQAGKDALKAISLACTAILFFEEVFEP